MDESEVKAQALHDRKMAREAARDFEAKRTAEALCEAIRDVVLQRDAAEALNKILNAENQIQLQMRKDAEAERDAGQRDALKAWARVRDLEEALLQACAIGLAFIGHTFPDHPCANEYANQCEAKLRELERKK